jgi:competence protein ComEC
MAFWKKALIIILLSASSFVWYAVLTRPDGLLAVSFFNIGQGDAIFIETPSGNQVLIDGGPGRKILMELSDVMPVYDKSIDLIISTHTDFDHLAGLVEVLKRYDVGMVLENGFTADTKIYKEWEKLLADKKIPRGVVRAGDRINLDRDGTLNILGPVPEDFIPPPQQANEVMVVSQLVYGNNKFLFPGDIEKGDEIRLVHSSYDISSNILKVAHHGSKYSSTDLFLESVAPQYEIISAGDNNRYCHPHAETLARLKLLGAQLYRTDIDGRITLKSDGTYITIE